MRRTPALIVGGGPAGAALALLLARAEQPHLLVERTRDTGDALCGGFLSWRALAMLERLGIDAAALNPMPVTRVRLIGRTRMAEASLPFAGVGVSRRRLDTLLLAAARRAGAAVERGVGMRAFEGDEARSDDGGVIAADALFLASGKRDVRGLARPAVARGADPTIGLRVRLSGARSLDRAVGDTVELHLFDRGYGGLVRQEDGSFNLCLAVRRSRLAEAGSPDALLAAIGAEAPCFGDRLAWRDDCSPCDAVANVPYGWRAAPGERGLFRLGDQAGVIPSIAGEGMAIALASGFAAAAAYAAGGADGSAAYQRRFAKGLRRPIGIAGLAWHAAERPALADRLLRVAAVRPSMLSALARTVRVTPPG